MSALYTAVATSSGDGRNGHVRTDDGLIDADTRVPQAMGGPGGATNPEQLFAAGYAACFHSAIKLVGRQEKIDVTDSTVTAEVDISRQDVGFGLGVRLVVRIPNADPAAVAAVTEKAHQVCPYSNATRGNIEVDLQVV
ncbi:organic hydroperoxide resistance protein [Nakamurella sp.]|uniref:organic hydroperoxide resistance protein n=1 Tax=Nakamurella sp. TaxID=1869182 RepID=UPI0037831D06